MRLSVRRGVGFLPDRFWQHRGDDHGDLSLDSTRDGVTGDLCTQTLLGLGDDLDRRFLKGGSTTWSKRTMPPGDTAP
jgi:hypothetical protein